jgi:cytochrome P450
MTILISDDIYKDNIEMIIDECMTFFLAGTSTTSSAIGTTIAQCIKNPKIMSKVQVEIEEFLKANGNVDIYDYLNLEGLSELNYLQ